MWWRRRRRRQQQKYNYFFAPIDSILSVDSTLSLISIHSSTATNNENLFWHSHTFRYDSRAVCACAHMRCAQLCLSSLMILWIHYKYTMGKFEINPSSRQMIVVNDQFTKLESSATQHHRIWAYVRVHSLQSAELSFYSQQKSETTNKIQTQFKSHVRCLEIEIKTF